MTRSLAYAAVAAIVACNSQGAIAQTSNLFSDIEAYKTCVIRHAVELGHKYHESATEIVNEASALCQSEQMSAESDIDVQNIRDGQHESETDKQAYVQKWRNDALAIYLIRRDEDSTKSSSTGKARQRRKAQE